MTKKCYLSNTSNNISFDFYLNSNQPHRSSGSTQDRHATEADSASKLMQLYHRRKRQQELQIRSEFNPGEMISQLDNMVKDRLQGGNSANGGKDNLGGGIGGHPPLVLQGMQLYLS